MTVQKIVSGFFFFLLISLQCFAEKKEDCKKILERTQTTDGRNFVILQNGKKVAFRTEDYSARIILKDLDPEGSEKVVDINEFAFEKMGQSIKAVLIQQGIMEKDSPLIHHSVIAMNLETSLELLVIKLPGDLIFIVNPYTAQVLDSDNLIEFVDDDTLFLLSDGTKMSFIDDGDAILPEIQGEADLLIRTSKDWRKAIRDRKFIQNLKVFNAQKSSNPKN